jgi:hypothetical protein
MSHHNTDRRLVAEWSLAGSGNGFCEHREETLQLLDVLGSDSGQLDRVQPLEVAREMIDDAVDRVVGNGLVGLASGGSVTAPQSDSISARKVSTRAVLPMPESPRTRSRTVLPR